MNKKQNHNQVISDRRVSIVTGAAGDLGSAVARHLAVQGDLVVLVDLDDEALRSVESSMEGEGHLIGNLDISNEAAVKEFARDIQSRFQSINALFNNAGTNGGTHPIAEHPFDDFCRMFEVYVFGTFLMMKYFLPLIAKADDVKVLNTSSEAGLKANERRGAYSATKAAIIQLTRATALEYGRAGVRVNTLFPGTIAGAFMKRSVNPNSLIDSFSAHAAIADGCSLGRYAEADEIAVQACYRLTDAPTYVNGAVHLADGCRR